MKTRSSIFWMQGLVTLAAVVCIGGFPGTGPATADVPGVINYQGLVVDRDTGDPLPGEHMMRFRISDAASNGNLLWSEEQQVTVDTTGVVTVMLGEENTIDIAFDTACWLEVEVDGETLVPRRQMASVPYAFRSMNSGDADNLNGLDGDAYADSGHSHDDRYYTEVELHTSGTINNYSNPVDWTKLKNVPNGLADGTDDTGPGDGHSLLLTIFWAGISPADYSGVEME